MVAFVRGYFPGHIFQAMAREFSSINTSLEKIPYVAFYFSRGFCVSIDLTPAGQNWHYLLFVIFMPSVFLSCQLCCCDVVVDVCSIYWKFISWHITT